MTAKTFAEVGDDRAARRMQGASPARAQHHAGHPDAPETVEGRIQYILGLMSTGEYRGVATVRTLSSRWSMDASTVSRYAAEASRTIGRSVDKVALTGEILSTLARIAAEGEDKDAISACKLLADVTGLSVTRVDMRQGPAEMSQDEAKAALAAAVAKAKGMMEGDDDE